MDDVIIMLLLVGLLVEIPLALWWFSKGKPSIRLEEIVHEFNTQRRAAARVQEPSAPPAPPKPTVVVHKCEVRAYVYEDGQAVTIHTNSRCSQYRKDLVDPDQKYRGAFGRSLRPGVALKETRGGSHIWQE